MAKTNGRIQCNQQILIFFPNVQSPVALSDGNTSTDMNPQHTYVFHGNLTVNLSALNNLSITGSLSGEL
jgi:hypothetical protein